mgnify:FL=1
MVELTDRQKAKLKEHSNHHTKKHMDKMKSEMKKGKSFTQAHKEALKKVGNGKRKNKKVISSRY